jgi:hypothetical protein
VARNRCESIASQAAFSLAWSRGSGTKSVSGTGGKRCVCGECGGGNPTGDFGPGVVGETIFKE